LKTFTYDEILNDPELFYKQIVKNNNTEVDFFNARSKNENGGYSNEKPLKIVNVISVSGNFGGNCQGKCSEFTNKLLKKIALEQKYKKNKALFDKCPQKGKINIWNLGTSNNLSMCSDDNNGNN